MQISEIDRAFFKEGSTAIRKIEEYKLCISKGYQEVNKTPGLTQTDVTLRNRNGDEVWITYKRASSDDRAMNPPTGPQGQIIIVEKLKGQKTISSIRPELLTQHFDFFPPCSKCQGCCKLGDRYFVFIFKLEIQRLKDAGYKDFNTGNILNKKENGDCVFLGEEGCTIPHLKPLDCLCYPIMPLWENGEIGFLLDLDCRAAIDIPKEWIIEMKAILEQETAHVSDKEKIKYTNILRDFIFKKTVPPHPDKTSCSAYLKNGVCNNSKSKHFKRICVYSGRGQVNLSEAPVRCEEFKTRQP